MGKRREIGFRRVFCGNSAGVEGRAAAGVSVNEKPAIVQRIKLF
ncbi:MAG: hypothetical protein PUA83_03855 [Clostridiales bacterium]|nr:hypothetical protein [Clostridiales bacterium]